MSKTTKIKKYINLYDTYKKELTKVQRQIFELYYFEDYSLTEIAEVRKTTRAAIYDSLSKTTTHLEGLEKNIGFVAFKSKVK